MVRASLRGRRGRDCTRAFRGRVWTAWRVVVHGDGPSCLTRVRRTRVRTRCLGVYGGHRTDLPWCVWRTQNGLALVLTLVRAQAEYRLAFAVSGIADVTVV